MNRISALTAVGVLSMTPLALGAMCDFENGADPECNALGFQWLGAPDTGDGTDGNVEFTNLVNHTPGGNTSMFNDRNRRLQYTGVGIDTLWITAWSNIPATSVAFSGTGVAVTLTPGVWVEVDLGGATNFTVIPTAPLQGTPEVNFGTFAIDDVNSIPTPGGAAIFGIAALIARRRR